MYNNRDMFNLFGTLTFKQLDTDNSFWADRIRSAKQSVSELNNTRTLTPIGNSKANSINSISPTKSSDSPDTATISRQKTKPSYTYTKPESKAVTPSTENNTSAEPTDSVTTPTEDSNSLSTTSTQWLSYMGLNMNFSLAQFEQTISSFVEDAADGELQSDTLSQLSLGLHIDLQALGVYEETTQTSAETIDGSETALDTAAARHLSITANAAKMLNTITANRQYQAATFYQESEATQYEEKQVSADGFLRVSRKLAMRYTQDLSVNYNSLQSYNSQAAALTQTGNADQYISTTESLVDSSNVSGELIGQFFDTVQGYIDNMETDLANKVNTFFNNLAEQLGVESTDMESTKEMFLNGIASFFDKVDQAVTNAEDNYLSTVEQSQTLLET